METQHQSSFSYIVGELKKLESTFETILILEMLISPRRKTKALNSRIEEERTKDEEDEGEKHAQGLADLQHAVDGVKADVRKTKLEQTAVGADTEYKIEEQLTAKQMTAESDMHITEGRIDGVEEDVMHLKFDIINIKALLDQKPVTSAPPPRHRIR